MGTLRVMSRRGDDCVTWDLERVAAGEPAAREAVREAERIFQEHRTRGATAFRLDTGKPALRVDHFDQEADQILMVPRVVGG